MTTLIAVYNSSGCVGRCDARCYDAIHPNCDCICGGMNHRAGIDKAAGNTREMAEEWVEECKARHGLKDPSVLLNRPLVDQLSLFDFKAIAS